MNPTLLKMSGLALAIGLLQSPAAQADTTIRCESEGGRYQSCPVNTHGGVRLSRQLSHQGCWEGDTWGYDRNRIWVTGGCRAEFRVNDYSSGSSSSDNTGKVVAGALVLGVIAAAVASHNRDKDDDRYDDYYGHGGSWGGPDYTFTCESRNEAYTRCSGGNVRGGRGHVEVVRQLSKAPCRFEDSWGVERGQVWVDHGCRAEFGVYR